MYTGFIQTEEPARELPLGVTLFITQLVTKKSSSTTSAPISTGSMMAEVVVSVNSHQREEGEYPGGTVRRESPRCFCVTEGASIEGAYVAGAAPMLFLFSALRTFGICFGPHKEIPQLHFPWSPSPPHSNLHNCLTFASKWRAAGTKCLCHILLAAVGHGGCVMIYDGAWIDKMPLSAGWIDAINCM